MQVQWYDRIKNDNYITLTEQSNILTENPLYALYFASNFY